MVSAQEAGLAVDGVCEQAIDKGAAALEGGVSQTCRNAGAYLLGVQQWLEANVAKRGRRDASDLGATYAYMDRMLYDAVLRGAWNDTGVAMIDKVTHVCQCLQQRLPGHLHSLSLHVAADEATVPVHDGPTVGINGRFLNPWKGID